MVKYRINLYTNFLQNKVCLSLDKLRRNQRLVKDRLKKEFGVDPGIQTKETLHDSTSHREKSD